MAQRSRFSAEVRERAVRMVTEHRGGYASEWETIRSIAENSRLSQASGARTREVPRPSGGDQWSQSLLERVELAHRIVIRWAAQQTGCDR